MNILLTTFWEYPHVGGVSSYITTLKNGFESTGNNVYVLSYNNVKEQIGKQYTLISLIENFKVVFSSLVKEISIKNNIDIIVCNDVIALLASKQAQVNIPCLLTVHGYLADEYIASNSILKGSIEEKYLRSLEEIAYKISDNIITVGERLKKYINKITQRDVFVINNFVDINKFKFIKINKPDNKFTILFSGRLTKQKGVIFLIKAMELLLNEFNNIELIIIGNGEDYHTLKNYIKDKNLDNYIKFEGIVDNKFMPEMYNKSDVVVVPSIKLDNVEEPFGIVAIEAMACRKAVIASDIGGLREIIVDGYNGFLVPDKNPEAIAEKIKYIILNPELSKEIGQNARKTVEEKFSTEIAIKKYYNIYKKTIEKYYELRQWPFIIKNSATNIDNKMSILNEEEKKLIEINTLIIDGRYKDAINLINYISNNLINNKYSDVINYMKAISFTKINDLDNAFNYISMINSINNDKYRLLYGDILLLKNNYSEAIEQYRKLEDDKLKKIRLSLCEFVSEGYLKLKNHDDLISKCINIFKENNYKLNITYLPIVNGVTGGMRIIYEQINRLIERGHNVEAISYYGNPDWFDLKLNVKKISLGEKVEKYISNTDAIVYTFWNQWYEINNLDNTLFLIQGDEFLFDDNKLDTSLRETVTNSYIYSESKFLAVSRFLKETIQEKYNRNCTVIKNAIDTEKFYCNSEIKQGDKIRIIIVGNAMLKFKGFDDILKAFNIVKDKGYDFEVIWITQSQPEINLEKYIRVYVNPPQEKIPELYREADIYVAGSYYEACPLPPLEAMASGCAVVTTNSGGVTEYAKDGYNCLMSKPGDFYGLAEKIIQLIKDKDLRKKLVKNGLETVKEFTWNKAIDVLEDTLIENYLDVKPIKSSQFTLNTLSLCLITKDEEKNIARCINSVKDIVDEIVVVDTGSKDKTVEIAKKIGAKVIPVKWENDFSKARNIAIENATGDWILFLDADEEIKKEDVDKIRPLLNDDTIEAYIFKFVNYTGANLGSGITEVHYNYRLFRNNGKLKYIYPVHENLKNVEENRSPIAKKVDVTILHYGYLSNIRAEKNKTERYIKLISKYLEKHPDDKFQHGNLAVEYYHLGDYNKALKHLLIAVKGMDVNSYSATRLLRYLINTYIALKDYNTALRIIHDAKDYYIDVPDFKFLEGMLYMDQKRYEKAIEMFNECLSIGEYDGMFITMGGTGSYRARYMIAVCNEKLNRLNDAVKECIEILKENPNYQEVFIRLFDLLIKNEKPEDVYDFFNKYVDITSPVNNAIMAKLYLNVGLFEFAKKYLDNINIDIEGLNALKGFVYMGLRDYEKALNHFDMEYGKAKEEANYYKALCYIILNQIDKTKDVLWEISDSSDKKLYMTIIGEMKSKFDEVRDSYFNLLDLLIKLQEFDLYNKVLGLYVNRFTREDYEKYGQLMIKYGLEDLAVEAYIKAADLNTQNPEVYRYLAERALEQGMYDEALSLAANAFNIDRIDVDNYVLIYKIYKTIGKHDEAEEIDRMIKEIYPEINLKDRTGLY
ncbi:glycosyltransferase [Thermoanaerobacter indiensis]|uniref:glycosyltransferase n=1 Tax=Thermoanaerobacter indiensis TaxID=1125974 RepID=UPI0003669776|nr:glycosyltransferase [Thermoanaerobacter indiensis]